MLDDSARGEDYVTMLAIDAAEYYATIRRRFTLLIALTSVTPFRAVFAYAAALRRHYDERY